MSGYPYGNPAGGYPPQQYGAGNSGFQPPPPIPNYSDNQSCASLYGTPSPYDAYGGNQMPNSSYGMGGGNNYPPPSFNSYGANQMANAPYGMGGSSNYPPPPSGGNMPPPSQQFGGKNKENLNP
jgi:hypothetical protein